MATTVEFPIGPDKFNDLISGLFTAHVYEAYMRTLELGDASEEQELDPKAQHYILTHVLKDVVRWFPATIRPQFEEAAERLAAELLGGQVVFPNRRR